jgi:hypothetical protein
MEVEWNNSNAHRGYNGASVNDRTWVFRQLDIAEIDKTLYKKQIQSDRQKRYNNNTFRCVLSPRGESTVMAMNKWNQILISRRASFGAFTISNHQLQLDTHTSRASVTWSVQWLRLSIGYRDRTAYKKCKTKAIPVPGRGGL